MRGGGEEVIEIILNKRQQKRVQNAMGECVCGYIEDSFNWPETFWEAIDDELLKALLPIVRREIKTRSADPEFIESLVRETIKDKLR